MPCKLKRDPASLREWNAPAGSTITMCIDSTSKLAKLTASIFEGKEVAVNNDACTTFTLTADSGETDVEILVFISADPNDTIIVLEDCGDGTKKEIERFPYNPTNPTRGFRIVTT